MYSYLQSESTNIRSDSNYRQSYDELVILSIHLIIQNIYRRIITTLNIHSLVEIFIFCFRFFFSSVLRLKRK